MAAFMTGALPPLVSTAIFFMGIYYRIFWANVKRNFEEATSPEAYAFRMTTPSANLQKIACRILNFGV
jgi:hypothetical protein